MKKRVLIVEDEAIIAIALAEALSDGDVVSDHAGNCAAAIERLTAGPGLYAGAIVDVGLPDGRGDALADVMRNVSPHLPIVLCTAYGLGEIRCDAFAEGGVVVVGKPFLGAQIREALCAAVADAASAGAAA